MLFLNHVARPGTALVHRRPHKTQGCADARSIAEQPDTAAMGHPDALTGGRPEMLLIAMGFRYRLWSRG